VPNQNFYSLGTVIAIYLALYAAVEGKGATCPFPGSSKSWVAKSNDSPADVIARQTIYLSLRDSQARKGDGYNVADAKTAADVEYKLASAMRMFRPPRHTTNGQCRGPD
jgi:hypothetical protein